MISAAKKNNILFFTFSIIFFIFLILATGFDLYYLASLSFVLLFFLFGLQNPYGIFFLLIALLPWSIQYHFSGMLSTDVPDEFLMLVIFFLVLLFCLQKPVCISSDLWKHSLIILLGIHFIWITVSVFFTTSGLISVKYLLAKTWYIGAFVFAPLIFLKSKSKLRIAGIIFIVSMFAVVLVVLLRHSIHSFSFATINEAVIPFFHNHVIYSAMLVCSFPFLLLFYKKNLPPGKKVFFVVVSIIFLSALYFSYSRGAWLALLAGILSFPLIRKKFLFSFFITTLVVIFALLFWIKSNDRYLRFAHDYKTTIYHKDFREHLVATYKLKDVSTAERFYRWIAAVRMIKDNWITGYGPGTFYHNYKSYAIPAFKTWVSKNEDHSTVHNYFLLVVTEQGIPGLFFFLLLLCGMIYYAQRLYQRIADSFYKKLVMATGSVIIMLAVVNFLSDLVETDKIGSIFFLCLSLLIIADLKTRNEKSDFSPHTQSIS